MASSEITERAKGDDVKGKIEKEIYSITESPSLGRIEVLSVIIKNTRAWHSKNAYL